MAWKTLLSKRLVQAHKTSREEVQNIRSLIKRDIEDAQITELSIDRRFATAYGAAVNLARLAAFCTGYRILAVAGHHRTSFDAATIALGPDSTGQCAFFDTCRRKRNKIDYDFAEVASESEVAELLEQVLSFQSVIARWISEHYPNLE